ncbi:SLT1 protein [Musa troglodytarum]|uniref:UDP-glucuronic acid decarboxylase 1 n=1 Tax=Musa troglodytarum TaxID=320322 RepID=A0A9E7KR32_9LILI|nr:SLT1 protein [Musa troglodytarum]
MGESILTTLSMENHHHHPPQPSTLLSMDPAGPPEVAVSAHNDCDHELSIIQQRRVTVLSGAPDINLPLLVDQSPPQQPWDHDPMDVLEVGLGPQIYDHDAVLHLPKAGGCVGGAAGARKCAKRGDSIWGAWFFFNFYFKPALVEKSKSKIIRDANGVSGFDKSDLRLDVFLVQHDMENMYMWVFKERPENALGKMQLRSYMNGHSRQGEPQFPFSVDKGFMRSHRMQRKQYRGLSNPQCVHGIEVVRSPNLSVVAEADRKKWMELTGRDLSFSIPLEAYDFESWRNLPSTDFELERPPPPLKSTSHPNSRKLLNGSGLNLSTQPSNHAGGDCMDLSPVYNKRRKDFFSHGANEDVCMSGNPYSDRPQDTEVHPAEPSWVNEFTGVMRHACGPVTAAKTIYEDEEGYLIMVSLPFSDQQRVKVSWKNTLTHGIVKISCVSTARMPYVKRHDRTFRLTDPSPEHCPPGEFVREIPLATRIPEDAKLEAYYDESGTVLEIMVPKHSAGPEEHEVRVCMRPPHLGANELMPDRIRVLLGTSVRNKRRQTWSVEVGLGGGKLNPAGGQIGAFWRDPSNGEGDCQWRAAYHHEAASDSFATPVFQFFSEICLWMLSAYHAFAETLSSLQPNLRILVTGGAGFIGSHLVDKLMENEKNEVIVVDNYFTGSKDNLKKWVGHPRFELIRHDVTEKLLVEVDQIYHLACPASPIFYKYNPVKFDCLSIHMSYILNFEVITSAFDIYQTIKTNVIGTLNMLGLAKRVGARILLTSTSEVYGDPLEHPQKEEYWGNVNPIGVRSCYDEGKRVAETLMFDYHRQHGIVTFSVIDYLDFNHKFANSFCSVANRGEPLTVQSPGTQTRSFCYVSDMVDGLIRLMEGEHTGPINIGNPGEFTMMELAEAVKELIDPAVPVKIVENTPDDPRQRKPDITKAKELLGWEPKITLREGLPLMEDDFRQRLGVPKRHID